MTEFRGIYPALVTASTADGGVSVPGVAALVEYLIGKGVDGLYVGGTTGEGIYMTAAERQLLAETVLKRVNGRIPVIMHIASMSLNEAKLLARHAVDHGAAGIASIMPPMYNTHASVVAYYKGLAAAVPETPFFSYILNPAINPVAVLQELLDVPNLHGVKYTGSNMYEMRLIMDMNAGRWITFSGMDEQAVYARMMGVHGFIGSTLNYIPGAYRAIFEAVGRGDYAAAQSMQEKANLVTKALYSVGFNGALRETLRIIGVDCGEPRLPAIALTAEGKAALRRALDQTDFAELAAL